MKRIEWIKQELENLRENDLVSLWNEYCYKNSYEPIYLVNELDLNCVLDLSGDALEIINRIKRDFSEFDTNDKYYTVDGYGNFNSYNDPSSEIDLDALAEAIDNENIDTFGCIDLDDFEDLEETED
jgi:hypothetical protein